MDNNQNYNQNVQTPVPVQENQPVVVYQSQPQYAQQPVYTQPAGQVVKSGSNKALSIVALICGICSLVFCYVPFVGLGCGIAAIITAGIARRKGGNGMNTTGKILGIIGTVVSAIFTLAIVVSCVDSASYSYDYGYYYTVFVNSILK